ncbi:MAG: hypothetical protein JXR88_15280 [Clostridia bacterium]|nr:hypothetical protein [Clostridia bacterium]
MKYAIGIDSGSATTKGVLFDGREILKKIIVPTGPNPRRTMEEIYIQLKEDKEAFCVTTGYGRDLLEQSDKSVTEITCHGIGAAFLCPGTRGVIDIGGQDSKVILLDQNAFIKDFLMNDKCAAGTGRFVEMISRILHQDLADLDAYVKDAHPIKISSMCTVFAESEVIGLLAQNTPGPDIGLGVIHSICKRTAMFAGKLPLEGKVFFSGGLSNFKTIQHQLQEELKREVITHELAQFAGAIGAAKIGYDKHKSI